MSDAHVDSTLVDGQPIDAKHFLDASTLDAGPRGPAAFQLPGGGNAALWDDANQALYLTDDTHDTLVQWTDAGGFTTFGTFPTESAGIALGAIVKLADGSFLVPSLGFGTQGTLFTMTADGSSSGTITGLDATRRRIGLAQDATGLLYEAYFVGAGAGMQTGGVASVVVAAGAGTETAITTTTALKKTVGIAATATTLYVCDQTTPVIYAVVIATGATSVFAKTPSCDQISTMPNGDLVTGSLTGGAYRIDGAGAYTTVESGFDQVRGTAYDPTHQRIFIVEHSSAVGGHDRLHVFPLDN